jgi:hypothetical protein
MSKTYNHYAKFWSVQYPNQWAETLNPSTHQAHTTTVQLPWQARYLAKVTNAVTTPKSIAIFFAPAKNSV